MAIHIIPSKIKALAVVAAFVAGISWIYHSAKNASNEKVSVEKAGPSRSGQNSFAEKAGNNVRRLFSGDFLTRSSERRPSPYLAVTPRETTYAEYYKDEMGRAQK